MPCYFCNIGVELNLRTAEHLSDLLLMSRDTTDSGFTKYAPNRLVGDKAYDSDKLYERLKDERGVEMIAPHRRGRKKPQSQDGRKLRRYRRRLTMKVGAKMENTVRISAQEVRQKVTAQSALLVCAYDDMDKFRQVHLEGAIPFSEFKSRLPDYF